MINPRRLAAWLGAAGVAAGVWAGGSAMAQLAGEERDTFVRSSIESCTATIRQSHADFPASIIDRYCSCMASAEADITTQDDLAYIGEHHSATDDYKSRVEALAPKCNAAAGLH